MESPDAWAIGVVFVVIALGVGIVAVSGGGSGGSLNTSLLGADAIRSTSSLESYTLSVTQTITYRNTTWETRTVLSYEKGWYNFTHLAPRFGDGLVFVGNDSITFQYNRSESIVYRLHEPAVDTPNYLASLVRTLFADRNASFEGNHTLRGEKTMKLEYRAGGRNLSLIFGGTRVSRIDLADVKPGSAKTEVWMDPTRDLPRKIRLTAVYEGDPIEVVVRLEDVRLGIDVPDERFDPPGGSNTTVERVDPITPEWSSSLSAIRANASGPTPAIDPPEGFAFSRGAILRGNDSTAVVLHYTNGISTLTTGRYGPNASLLQNRSGDRVTVAGHSGRFVQRKRVGYVIWQCAEYQYLAAAPLDVPLSRGELLHVARSLGCPS